MVIQNRFTNQPIADWKAGKISKEEASKKIRYIYRGGGGGSSSAVAEAEARGRAAAAAQAKKRIEEEAKRQAEIKRIQAENKKIREQIDKEKKEKAFGQTISGQVTIKEDKKGFNESFGTRTDYGNQNIPTNVNFSSKNNVSNNSQISGLFAGGLVDIPAPDRTGQVYDSRPDVIPIVVTPGLDLIKPTGDTGYSTHIESLIGKDSPMGKLVGGGAGQTLTTKEKEFLSKAIPIAGGLAVTVGGIAVVPPAVRIGADLIFTPYEIKTALDPTKTTSQRLWASGSALLGTAGLLFEGLPFVRGAMTKLTGVGIIDDVVDASKLHPTGTASVIKDIPVSGADDVFDIKLIQPGSGYGFSTAEQSAFIGKGRTVTTSARDLFKGTDDLVTVKSGDDALGLFFTPSIGAGETRVSRLGLKDLWKSSDDLKLGFKVDTPQIVFARNVDITTSGKPGSFRGLGLPSSELEATLLPGQTLRGSKVGATVIKGQTVELFESFVDAGSKVDAPLIDIPGLRLGRSSTTVDTISPVSFTRTLNLFGGTTTIPVVATSTPIISPTTTFQIFKSPPTRTKKTPAVTTPRISTPTPYKPTPSYPIFRPTPYLSLPYKPTPSKPSPHPYRSSYPLFPTMAGIPFPRFPKIGEKPKAKRQLYKQPTKFQTSFSGSILNLKMDMPGFMPGGLSLRGILPTKKLVIKQSKKSDKKRKRFWWE